MKWNISISVVKIHGRYLTVSGEGCFWCCWCSYRIYQQVEDCESLESWPLNQLCKASLNMTLMLWLILKHIKELWNVLWLNSNGCLVCVPAGCGSMWPERLMIKTRWEPRRRSLCWKRLSGRRPESEPSGPGTHDSSPSTLTPMSGTTNTPSTSTRPHRGSY